MSSGELYKHSQSVHCAVQCVDHCSSKVFTQSVQRGFTHDSKGSGLLGQKCQMEKFLISMAVCFADLVEALGETEEKQCSECKKAPKEFRGN